uniref:Uncharacterized protein n=1 Tax=Anopheles maculatus TaxID=74869 RepID=A0A182SKG5_9DIPT
MLVLRRFTLTGRLFGEGAPTFGSGSCVPLFSVTAVVDETVPVDDEEMAILVVRPEFPLLSEPPPPPPPPPLAVMLPVAFGSVVIILLGDEGGRRFGALARFARISFSTEVPRSTWPSSTSIRSPTIDLSPLSATSDLTLLLPTPSRSSVVLSSLSIDVPPFTFCFSPENRFPVTLVMEGDFLIGTCGFLPSTGGGVAFLSSRFSKLLRMSDALFSKLLRGGFSVRTPVAAGDPELSVTLLSSDLRCAATLLYVGEPVTEPAPPTLPTLPVDSFNESFDPKLSFRYAAAEADEVDVCLPNICILLAAGGRSGFGTCSGSFTGDTTPGWCRPPPPPPPPVTTPGVLLASDRTDADMFADDLPPSGGSSETKLSGNTPTRPRSSPFHQPLSGSSFERIVMMSPSTSFSSSSLAGWLTPNDPPVPVRAALLALLSIAVTPSPPTLPLLRLDDLGDTDSIISTKLDGNTPTRPFSLPRHQPSST